MDNAEKSTSTVCKTAVYIVGFEVLTAVVMKSFIFWDVTPCSLLKVDRRFGGTFRFHLQGRIREHYVRFEVLTAMSTKSMLFVVCYFSLLFDPVDGGSNFLRNYG
jgi:hypothetical protein